MASKEKKRQHLQQELQLNMEDINQLVQQWEEEDLQIQNTPTSGPTSGPSSSTERTSDQHDRQRSTSHTSSMAEEQTGNTSTSYSSPNNPTDGGVWTALLEHLRSLTPKLQSAKLLLSRSGIPSNNPFTLVAVVSADHGPTLTAGLT